MDFKTSYLEVENRCVYCKKPMFHTTLKKDNEIVNVIKSCYKCRMHIKKIHKAKYQFDEKVDDFNYYMFDMS